MIQVGLNPTSSVLFREHTGRRPREDTDRDWSDLAVSPRSLGPPRAGGGREGPSHGGGMALPTPCSQTSGPQTMRGEFLLQ